ncbi:putative oxidoreductase YusZ [Cytospora mali]|uniref:Oxidoreductase YusZ n=1 Tax=Cytospora mali TaxID=578113 RepID=A0A194VPF3_CYTMA|nr:putative oxidoreductase YusZ [Valsa mali]
MSPPVWLITGASSGFGLMLCLRALKAGHKVIGTMRSLHRASEAVTAIESAGGNVIEMDMTESQAGIKKKIQDAEGIFGSIDILVNNAGFAMLGPIAEFTDKEITTQFQTNVYGPFYAVQAVLPGMRSRRSGTIVNISSVAGQDSLPTSGLYAASKFALEGFSEALSREEAEFGITVLIVEPGAFRTNFLRSFQVSEKGVGEGGPAILGQAMDRWYQYEGKQPGDPEKGVEVIYQVVTGEGEAGKLKGKTLRLPLGKDCVARVEAKTDRVKQDVETAREVAYSTDF